MFFYSLKKNGKLRVALLFEIIGLDFIMHQSEGTMQISNLQEEQRKELLRQ